MPISQRKQTFVSASISPIRIIKGEMAVFQQLCDQLPNAVGTLIDNPGTPMAGISRHSATTASAVFFSHPHGVYEYASGPLLYTLEWFNQTLQQNGMPVPDDEVMRAVGLSVGRC